MDRGEEQRRLAALRAYAILDTLPEREFDDCVRLAAAIAGTPAAGLTFVDEKRQWVKAGTGLWFGNLPREDSFCTHVVADGELILEDTALDPRFADHPAVTDLGIRFYAAWPLRAEDGSRLGALFVVDRTPHVLSEDQHRALALVARQVENLLVLRRGLQASTVLATV